MAQGYEQVRRSEHHVKVPFAVFLLTTLAFIAWHIVRGMRQVVMGKLLNDTQYTADCKEIWQDYLTANNGGSNGEDNTDRR